MGVHRLWVECEVCDTPLTIRHTVGFKELQEASFSCPTCYEAISYGIHFKFSLPIQIRCFPKENCRLSAPTNSLIVNINSTNALLRSQYNDPHYFPTIDLAQNGVFDRSGKQDGKTLEEVEYLEDTWSQLKTLISLYINNKDRVFVKKYSLIFGRTIEKTEIQEAIYSFLKVYISAITTDSRIGKHFYLVKKEIESACELNRADFQKLTSFLSAEYRKKLRKYLETIESFMDAKDALNPIRIRNLLGMDMQNIQVDACHFSLIKQLYGNYYEFVTSKVCIYSCINNLQKHRSWNQFERISFEDYLKSDKANRTRPFKDHLVFGEVESLLLPKLRNGSHHGNIEVVPETGLVEYSAGKPLKKYSMSLEEYSVLTYRIFEYAINLIGIELWILSKILN